MAHPVFRRLFVVPSHPFFVPSAPVCVQEPFHNYFELFLKQKFKNPRRLIEVAVNILESLKKYAFDR